MDFGLNEDQREIQRTARELLANRAKPTRVREHAEAGRFDEELWAELCELGWPGIAVGQEHGGYGLGAVELAILSEELGRVLAPVPLVPSALAATVIEHAGDWGVRSHWLPRLASGEVTGALVDAESGYAPIVPAGGMADVFVVLEGARAWVVKREDAAIEARPSIDPTMPAVSISVVPKAGQQLGGDVRSARARALVMVAAGLVGVCDRALELTTSYVKERKQFGTPVGAYQAVSHGCTQMLLDTEKARVTTAYAAWCADAEPRLLRQTAAMAKASASDAARSVTCAAIQLHGGVGFTWEADVHWLYKRAHVDSALLGDGLAQRARLLSELLAHRTQTPARRTSRTSSAA